MSSSDSWAFAAGDEIVPGRVVHRLLGGGRSYEAYLAFDEGLYSAVVVKVLRPGLVADAKALRGLRREVEMLGRLNHPVVVRSFGATLDGPRPQVVLEHLEGPRLSRLLRKYGPLPLEQLLPLALEICSALHYLAGQGVVHLDVKPSNIIMGAPPRLIDLSVARSLEAAAALRHVVGTDAYLAPEQADPATEPPGSAADVFGVGATLFQACAGFTPWSSKDRVADDGSPTWPQLHKPPRDLPSSVPAPVADLVLACLARKPADRPSPAQVAEAVEPLIARLPKPVLGGFRPQKRR
ncbi:MAG: serine/threonine-protein kinase [Actinomycetes bacterium]